MKTTVALIVPLLAMLLTGCVGVVPVPSTDKSHGHIITPQAVKFIVPGRTIREQVVLQLGDQFRDSPHCNALSYSWEKPAASMIWWWIVMTPYGGGGDTGYIERTHWAAFFVAFDDADMVKQTDFISLSTRKSLDEQLDAWAQKRGAAPTHTRQAIVAQ